MPLQEGKKENRKNTGNDNEKLIDAERNDTKII